MIGQAEGTTRMPPCFDPSKARYRTRMLPVDRVIDLLQITHAPEQIASYRAQMEQGERFPPVSVVVLGGRFYLADGHKRFSAYRDLGRPTIVVEVWPLYRWMLDQWHQVVDNGRKNWRIVTRLRSDRSEARRLLVATLGHWYRVTVSLWSRRRGSL